MRKTREANATIVSTIDGCQYRLFIEQDEDAYNPRKDNENISTIISWSRDYETPDKADCMPVRDRWCDFDDVYHVYTPVRLSQKAIDDCEWSNLVAALQDNGQYIIIPIRHDGDGIQESYGGNTNGYACMSKATILHEWGKNGAKVVTAAMREKAISCLRSEMTEYNQWASGDVHGIIIDRTPPDAEGDFDDHAEVEELDSCWGFYGYDYAREEGLSILKHYTYGNSATENARNLQGLKELAHL